MGCDYYIDKNLEIYFDGKSYCSLIRLEHNSGYFYDINGDSDEEDYEKKEKESINEQLKPKMKPIVIYSEGKFMSSSFEIKYKILITDKLSRENKKWEDIRQIVKRESRYERD
jgi:hypothetical protein